MRILLSFLILLGSWQVMAADELQAQYEFNQSDWDANNSVLDTSGNGNHGSAVGTVSPLSYDGGSCRLLNIPSNTSTSVYDAVDTQVDINSIGNEGSIAFWYRSNLSWSNATKRQLLDASNRAPSQDKYFYLSLGGGQLQFGLEDTNDFDVTAEISGLSYAAGQWVLIIITWDLPNNVLQVYQVANGSGTVQTETENNLVNNLGDMDTLYIGDNRSSYIVGNGTGNSANGQIEDVRIYNFKISLQQAINLISTEPSCETLDSVLVSHWPMDVCALDGTSGEVIDIVGGANGTAIDGANIDEDGKLCQASEYAGNGEHINIPHDNAFNLSDGSISMWFRIDDLDPVNNSYFNGRVLFSKDSTDYDGGGHLSIYVDENGRVRARHQSTSSNYNLNSSANLVSENQWYHLVYTFGSTGIKIYLDKDLVATNNYTGGISGNAEPIILGAGASHTGDNESDPDDLRDYYMGEIDDVRLYQGQLSQTEIDNLYAESEGTCLTCNIEILIAHYQFEQSEWAGTGDVIDSSSNNNNASALGSATPINPSEQVACKAMEIPQSSSLIGEVHALDTNVDLDSYGNKGTISFWYRSNEAWNSGNSRQLFDASKDLGDVGDSRFFYFSLRTNGRLDFKFEDENDLNFGALTNLSYSYAADTWVHVAVNWDLTTQVSEIYLDGVKQSVSITAENNLSTVVGDFDTLYIGDNRSAYLSNASSRNSANGEFDDVRIYSYAQTSSQVNIDKDTLSTCSFIHKYLIEHDGNGLTCEAEPVTIKACLNESCSELYDQDITVDVSPSAGWPDGGTVTILANTAASLELTKTSPGTVTLDVLDEDVECTGVSGGSCDLTFSDAGFQFIGASNSTAFPDQVAESNFSAAQLRAVRSDDSSGSNVCVAALEGQQNVVFNLSCDDPSVCLTPVETGNTSIVAGSDASVTLTFDSNGYASLGGFSYADAGQISLSVQGEIDDSTYTNGSTQFVVYPDYISIAPDSSTTLSRAGADFGLVLSARGTQNGVLPNYQPEQMEVWLQRTLPTNISGQSGVLTYAQSATVIASDSPSFTTSVIANSNANVSNTNGIYTFTADYAEYGSVNLDIRDANYFGHVIGSQTASGSSPTLLGLFLPAYFDIDVNAPELESSCDVSSGFTYLGQDTSFSNEPEFVVTAKNAKGNTTTHYQSNSLWSWLSSADADDILLSDDAHNGSISFFTTPSMVVTDEGVEGSRTLTVSSGQVLYSKSTNPYAPFSASMDMNLLPSFFTDTTYSGAPVCYHQSYNAGDDCDASSTLAGLDDTNNLLTVSSIGGTEYRWGRIVIDNGYGPETENILLPVSTEYYNGTAFVRNTDDTCTSLSLTASNFSITDSEGNSTSAINILDSTLGVTSGKTLGFEGIAVNNSDSTLMGEYNVELLPVGDGTITWDDFLQYDWNGNDTGIGNPSAIITFGQFRGNDRIIHWRETGN